MYHRTFCSDLPGYRWILGLLLVLLGGQAATASTGTSAGVHIVNARSVEGELRVELLWEPSPAGAPPLFLVVANAAGAVAAETPVVPPVAGGSVTVALPRALRQLASLGLRYRIFLEDGDGEVVAGPYAFFVRLDCPTAGSCSTFLARGFESEALVGSPALAAALDEAAATPEGQLNLLAAAVGSHPAIRGDATSLAWQLGEIPLGKQAGGGGEPSPCRCFWMAAHSVTVTGGGCCGATHAVKASAVPFHWETGGTTSLGLELRCFILEPGPTMPTDIDGLLVPLTEPILHPCPVGCAGNVVHSMSYEAAVSARAKGGTAAVPVVAQVEAEAGYAVDGVPTGAAAQAAVLAVSTDSNLVTDADAFTLGRIAFALQPSTATLTSGSILDLQGPVLGQGEVYATGEYRMTVQGSATCAQPATALVTIERAAILPRDETGTNLSILIGDCP